MLPAWLAFVPMLVLDGLMLPFMLPPMLVLLGAMLALPALAFALIVTLALLMTTLALPALALALPMLALLVLSPPPQAERPATPTNARSAKVLRIDRSPE